MSYTAITIVWITITVAAFVWCRKTSIQDYDRDPERHTNPRSARSIVLHLLCGFVFGILGLFLFAGFGNVFLGQS
jgi:uncharacterized membrane protein YfcA